MVYSPITANLNYTAMLYSAMYVRQFCSVFSGGVSHTSSCALTGALASISILTISTCPSSDAAMSGVKPFCVD